MADLNDIPGDSPTLEGAASSAAGDGANEVEDGLKLHVTGINKYDAAKVLVKYFAKHGVHPIHTRKVPKAPWCVLAFPDVEVRNAAMSVINRLSVQGWALRAIVHRPEHKKERAAAAETGQRAAGEKRSAEQADLGDGEDGDASSAQAATKPWSSDIRDLVTPLHATPYAQQLAIKQDTMAKECILKATRRLKKLFHKRQQMFAAQKDGGGASSSRAALPAWLQHGTKEDSPIPTEAIRPSPVTEAYRNKCDFTIGVGGDGLATVGFCKGREKDGTICVAAVDEVGSGLSLSMYSQTWGGRAVLRSPTFRVWFIYMHLLVPVACAVLQRTGVHEGPLQRRGRLRAGVAAAVLRARPPPRRLAGSHAAPLRPLGPDHGRASRGMRQDRRRCLGRGEGAPHRVARPARHLALCPGEPLPPFCRGSEPCFATL